MDRKSLHNLNENMSDAERIVILEQLLEEDALKELTSLELAPMPAYLEEEILEAILGEKQRAVYRPPKWLQLFSYSVKITFAAACAILVLFQMPDMGSLNRERLAMERAQETLAREEEAAKRQQEMLKKQEKRRQKDSVNSSYIADVLQFVTGKFLLEE